MEGFESIVKEFDFFFPKEAPAQIVKKSNQLYIGIPKETDPFENRITLRPEAVQILVKNGHNIIVESGAGDGSKHLDSDYSEAGATIVSSKKEVYDTDIILKINPPSADEYQFLKSGQTIISTLSITSMTKEFLQLVNRLRITCVAYDMIRDKGGEYPIVKAMSEIAGSTVMLIAGDYLSSSNDGKGIILGGITGVPPSKVVVLGSGTVAEMAVRTALGLGADVKVFDNHVYRLRRLKSVLTTPQLYTCTLDTAMLKDALKRADVVIGAIRPLKDGGSITIITEEMVASMKPNSVIVDVSIDHGGCFETSTPTTHANPIFKKYDVIHYCVPNIASRVPRTATAAISNILTPLLLKVAGYMGIDEVFFNEEGLANGVYTYKGSVTKKPIAERFNERFNHLNLIIGSRGKNS